MNYIPDDMKKIASDLHGNPIKSAYARTFMSIISNLPMYFNHDKIIVPEEEVKYLEHMRGMEEMLFVYGRDPKIIESELNEKCKLLRNIRFKSDPVRLKAFIEIIKSYTRLGNVSHGVAHILKLVHYTKDVIEHIITCDVPIYRALMISEFDKYMRNLVIVGRDNVCQNAGYYDKIIPCIPRIPDSDKYYVESIGSPTFDIARFLINGPYTIFFGCRRFIINKMYDTLLNYEALIKKYDKYPEYITTPHKWDHLSTDQKNENFKITFPEPVGMIDILCFPF